MQTLERMKTCLRKLLLGIIRQLKETKKLLLVYSSLKSSEMFANPLCQAK